MGANKRLYEEKLNRRVKQNRMPLHRWPIDVTIEGDTGITQQWERQMDEKAVKKFNEDIKKWGQKVDAVLRSSIAIHIDKDEELSSSLKQNYRHYGKAPKKGEEITSIGFRFREEGVYVHLGVGMGYNMEGGTRVLTKKTDNEWRRQPKAWFNPVIQQFVPELMEIVREYCGSLIINTTRIFIN